MPSAKNWRWDRVKEEKGNKNEKLLEKRIVLELHEKDWANAIPTASGTYHSRKWKLCHIDLGLRTGNQLQFFELKWDSNHQLYAAMELMAYACQWLLAKPNSKGAALDATNVAWVVLAPARFYKGRKKFAKLQRALDEGIRDTAKVRAPGIPMSFRFEEFAEVKGWETNRAALREMVENRRPVYE